jgi:hypothetical protein
MQSRVRRASTLGVDVGSLTLDSSLSFAVAQELSVFDLNI